MSERSSGDESIGSSTPSGASSGPGETGRHIVSTPLRAIDSHEGLIYRLSSAAIALLGVLLVVGALLALRGHSASKAAAAADAPHSASPSGAHSAKATATSSSPQHVRETSHPTHSSAPSASPRPTPKPTPTRASSTTTHPPAPPIVKGPLIVLNNTTQRGLAQQAADEFRHAGWQIGTVGNYAGRLSATTVYFDAGDSSQEAAAHELMKEFPKVTRVQSGHDGLPSGVHGLAVVLAPNWEG